MSEILNERNEELYYDDYDSDSAKSKEELVNEALDGLIDLSSEIENYSQYLGQNLRSDDADLTGTQLQLARNGYGTSSRRADDRPPAAGSGYRLQRQPVSLSA